MSAGARRTAILGSPCAGSALQALAAGAPSREVCVFPRLAGDAAAALRTLGAGGARGAALALPLSALAEAGAAGAAALAAAGLAAFVGDGGRLLLAADVDADGAGAGGAAAARLLATALASARLGWRPAAVPTVAAAKARRMGAGWHTGASRRTLPRVADVRGALLLEVPDSQAAYSIEVADCGAAAGCAAALIAHARVGAGAVVFCGVPGDGRIGQDLLVASLWLEPPEAAAAAPASALAAAAAAAAAAASSGSKRMRCDEASDDGGMAAAAELSARRSLPMGAAAASLQLETAAHLVSSLLGGGGSGAQAAVLNALAPLFEPAAAVAERQRSSAALAELRIFADEVSRLAAVAGSQWFHVAPPGAARRCRYMAFCRHLQGQQGCLYWHTDGERDLIAATRVFEAQRDAYEAAWGPLESSDLESCAASSSLAPASSAPPLRLIGSGSSSARSAGSASLHRSPVAAASSLRLGAGGVSGGRWRWDPARCMDSVSDAGGAAADSESVAWSQPSNIRD